MIRVIETEYDTSDGLFIVKTSDLMAYTLSYEQFTEYGICVDLELDERLSSLFESLSQENNALVYAKRYTAKKLVCSYDMAKKLLSKGYSAAIIESVLDTLISSGYVNDSLYVENYIRDKFTIDKYSKKRIRYELNGKKIDTELINMELGKYSDDEELQNAVDLTVRKFKNFDDLDHKSKEKLYRFLTGRGYNYEIVSSVMDRFIK